MKYNHSSACLRLLCCASIRYRIIHIIYKLAFYPGNLVKVDCIVHTAITILPNLMELRNRKRRGGHYDYLRVLDGKCILQLPFFDLSRGEEDSAAGVDFRLVSTID